MRPSESVFSDGLDMSIACWIGISTVLLVECKASLIMMDGASMIKRDGRRF